MLIDKYFSAIDGLLDQIKTGQKEAILKAGDMIAESVAAGGCIHIHDTGHIIDSELINRGGGPELYKRFQYTFTVNNPVRQRDRSGLDTSMVGLASYALKASGAMPGDVMILGSVSGRNIPVVDLAIEAKNMGLKLVVVTSMLYTQNVQSDHPSGKRLFELADVVIDNCAPTAEAMMDVDGIEARVFAASGISGAFIMWSITAQVIDQLMEKGITPSVLKSINYPGGREFNAGLAKIYAEKGW